MNYFTLDELDIGDSAYVYSNEASLDSKIQLRNLGLCPGTFIKCLFKSVFGDPTAYLFKDVVVSIRSEDAKNIIVSRDFYGSY